jgi:hypothetical protein
MTLWVFQQQTVKIEAANKQHFLFPTAKHKIEVANKTWLLSNTTLCTDREVLYLVDFYGQLSINPDSINWSFWDIDCTKTTFFIFRVSM